MVVLVAAAGVAVRALQGKGHQQPNGHEESEGSHAGLDSALFLAQHLYKAKWHVSGKHVARRCKVAG